VWPGLADGWRCCPEPLTRVTSIDTRAAARGQRSSATGTLKDLENRARLAFKALNDFVVLILSADVAHSGLLAE
jgi:hypothetical protein